jgi:hypothetical protein
MSGRFSQSRLGEARHLRPLLDEVVFLGGCTTELFVTDSGAAEARPTVDVDVVVEITSPVKYWEFSDRLRELGFSEDTREDVIAVKLDIRAHPD